MDACVAAAIGLAEREHGEIDRVLVGVHWKARVFDSERFPFDRAETDQGSGEHLARHEHRGSRPFALPELLDDHLDDIFSMTPRIAAREIGKLRARRRVLNGCL